MRRRRGLKKTALYVGVVVSVLLAAVWLVSLIWYLEWRLPSGTWIGLGEGRLCIEWDNSGGAYGQPGGWEMVRGGKWHWWWPQPWDTGSSGGFGGSIGGFVIPVGIVTFVGYAMYTRANRRRTKLECVHCGYSMVGLPEEGECPECGRDRSALSTERRDVGSTSH
jgi:hypothetical protein